ncbi:DUF4249 family protein [Lewinella sp. IMCC34191]|uniref:DUF4249 family protein n=1 Tax=Lewinella sp. IMCC34191 TaxID=2259172 RepID=UPI000E2705FF|nr:DUF4249 family protein [Lewinella sp. IMCC34191]
MRHLPPISPFLIIVMLATGCAEFFDREIEVDALPYERQLVLTTILTPQDSLIRADVFVTAPAVGDLPPDYPTKGLVTEARVTLVGPAGSFPFAFTASGGWRTYTLPQTEARLKAGETYEVVAEWDGLTARGEVLIPERNIPLDSIILQQVVEDDGDRYVQARWPNQVGERDYYLLYADQTYRRGGNLSPDIQRELADFLHGRDALGPYLSAAFSIRADFENTVNVCQTTQATYDYLLTRGTLEVNHENPFAEPTTVANTLQEGLGLVGAANCWQFEF